jgi:hypothetical protein
MPVGLAAPPVDLSLDRTHLLVCDHQEIARAAGRIENPDPCHTPAQVQMFGTLV